MILKNYRIWNYRPGDGCSRTDHPRSVGIDDRTIRADIDPFLTSMYLMISFMGILSLENKWKLVIGAEGFSNEQFSSEFFRFIIPAISSGEKSYKMDARDFEPFGFFLTKPVSPQKKKRKKILRCRKPQ